MNIMTGDGFLVMLTEVNTINDRAYVSVVSPRGESQTVDFDASKMWQFDDSSEWLESITTDAINRSGF